MVPLVNSFGEALGGEATFAIWSDWWEGCHFGRTGGKDVAVGSEPIGWFSFAPFPIGFVAEIENLHFDPIGKPAFPGGEFLDGGGAGPSEYAGISGVFFVHPFTNKFEIPDGFLHADDAHRFAGARAVSAVPSPGLEVTVDIHKVFAGELAPPLSGTVNEGFSMGGRAAGFCLFPIREALGGEDAEGEDGGSDDRLAAQIFQNHDLAIRDQDRNLVVIVHKSINYHEPTKLHFQPT